MAARPSSSREPSLLSVESLSRRSSLASNPDIFSDDYALEPIDLNLNLSLADSADTDDILTNSTITPYPAIPHRLSVQNRPSSTAKRTSGNESSSSLLRDTVSERTLSTSSRFSRVRAQSPYRGPTAPSHPYAMYPQITRASSVASQSTIRPTESSFVHTGGPEHPYALYSQNTVEDDDEDIGTQPIPLGFSALGYGSSRGTSNTDVGDIVLSDGHIEQLPPYTRYADNVVAKGDMNDLEEHHVVEMDATSSERASLMNANSSSSSSPSSSNDSTTRQDTGQVAEVVAKEPRWRQTAHKRVCGGIALWFLMLILVVILLAGLLGGVIGGVVGRRQGATEASSKAAATTIWLDADPATTNSSTPTCPTGRYSIPFNRTQEIDSCIPPSGNDVAWGCLDIAYLGMNIGRNPDGSPNVQFDDYSVDTTQFLYGPQPPDFNGSTISLAPHVDRDNQELGVAMFFYQEFDKLTILPNYALKPNSKRSISARDLNSRAQTWDKQPLVVGDLPWYCFWNSTISEFWIFLDQASNGTQLGSTTTTQSGSSTPTPTSTSESSQYGKGKGYDPSHPYTTFQESWKAYPAPTGHYPQRHKEKRSYVAPYLPQYPRLVKMVEKRRPLNNIQPYCQQMRVLANWEIVPQEKGQTIMIEELDWNTNPVSGGYKKRDTTGQLESNCVCEWMSI